MMYNDLSNQSTLRKAFTSVISKPSNRFCFYILLVYILVALLTQIGWLSAHWDQTVGGSYEAPNWVNYFGTDLLGRSVLEKVVHGVEVAMKVGTIVSLSTLTIGVLLGMVAGYFRGITDLFILWLYTVIASIPTMLLLMAVAFMLGKGIKSICMALIITEWTETCRLIRGEVIRQQSREYIQAASAIGVSHFRKLFIHILPNILPLIIYQFSMVFQTAIKYEVILSYLGLGLQNKPSWGIMINDAKEALTQGVWWELFFATMAMFTLVFVCNILADAFRNALDPKLKTP